MQKKYFIDLDNTLCKTQNSDYRNSVPIFERIEEVKRLKDAGHFITIWSARGSRSGKDWYELTKAQLNLWKVPFDSLILGKPEYDVYPKLLDFTIDNA